MFRRRATSSLRADLAFAAALLTGGLIVTNLATAAAPGSGNDSPTKGPFQFEPLLTSAPCTSGGNASQPFVLLDGYVQAS